MRIIDCEQGSEEWWAARNGIPTASEFDKILTPAQLKPSAQATVYMHKLIAEWLRGRPDESFESDWTKRGHELEAEACDAFNFIMDKDLQPVGFIANDDHTYGVSPDRWGDEGLEVKCPSAGVHVGYLLDGKVPRQYLLQVQGAMLITEQPHWWFMSYHPELDPLILKVKRDEKIIEKLHDTLTKFVNTLIEKKAYLAAKGYKRAA